jgi:hypothetical protein
MSLNVLAISALILYDRSTSTAHSQEGGNAVKRTLIMAAVILSIVAFAPPASAVSIQDYVDGPWMKFLFGSSYSNAYGNCSGTYCDQGPGTNFVDLGESPWTFTTQGSSIFRITDAFQRGDSFNVFDFGGQTPIVTTPSVDTGVSCDADPESCYGKAGVSYGSLILAAGPHSLTIQVVDSPYNSGAAYFRIDRIIDAPEPLSLMLLGLGLLGLGAVRRVRG